MTIGIPKGLLYSKFHLFARAFFNELGAEIAVSPDTNKKILDLGVNCCVDDACLPIKVFHGHAAWLSGKCDLLLVPRFMHMEKRKSICPMFCGLVEMVKNSVPDCSALIDCPIYALDEKSMSKWAQKAGAYITKEKRTIRAAYDAAMKQQRTHRPGLYDTQYPYTVALIGHSYLVHDRYINMNLIDKLHRLGLGVITYDYAGSTGVSREADTLFKQPFWYYGRLYYGAAMHLYRRHKVDGIIYISAFSCGVDSVVVALINNDTHDFPYMILKIDEHTGEAGFDTRLEAYADMLKRRGPVGSHDTASGQYVLSRQSVF